MLQNKDIRNAETNFNHELPRENDCANRVVNYLLLNVGGPSCNLHHIFHGYDRGHDHGHDYGRVRLSYDP
jgi:hypothetical protein